MEFHMDLYAPEVIPNTMKHNILLVVILLSLPVHALETTCNSCSDCSSKLNGDYDVVKLTEDIIDYSPGFYGTCITVGTRDVEFDCQGHRIDGDNSADSYGIFILAYIEDRSDNTISNCSITDFPYGIYIYAADYTTITGNTVGNATYGIHLKSNANYNTITDNEFIDNYEGIYLDVSGYNTITDNTFINCGLHIGVSKSNVVENNTLNGRPLVYLEDASGQTVDDAGQVLLVNCEDITVEGLTISNVSTAIGLWGTNNSRILNNNISSLNSIAIALSNSAQNIVAGNTANSTHQSGIALGNSDANTLANNTANSNRYDGIRISGSSYNILINNTVSENEHGIHLLESYNNTLRNNTIDSNNESGLYLWYSYDNNLYNNTFTDDGIYLYKSYRSAAQDNTIDGKPLVYLENTSDQTVDDAGQVILVRCDNITVNGLTLSNTNTGMQLWETNNSLIHNNTATGNRDGIYLHNSSNNTLTQNTANSNSNYGVHLDESDYNTLSGNNASENVNGIHVYHSDYNTLSENTLNSNSGDGIYLYRSDYNNITNNTALENEHGIHLTGLYLVGYSANNTLTYNLLCNNTGTDIVGIGGYLETNYGEWNTCEYTTSWSDIWKYNECTYNCTAVTTTTTSTSTSTTIEGCLTGDSDCSGTVSDFELLSYVDQWVQGEVDDFDLLEAIDNWASG